MLLPKPKEFSLYTETWQKQHIKFCRLALRFVLAYYVKKTKQRACEMCSRAVFGQRAALWASLLQIITAYYNILHCALQQVPSCVHFLIYKRFALMSVGYTGVASTKFFWGQIF